MRITRLEIFGFKSFLERLILPLETGITGVVGPNGCGKSNIVDALRWVLGESRASNLRGGTLEDVIFNGTDKLRPLGLAEVTLSLRASGQDFFSDLVQAVHLDLSKEAIAALSASVAAKAGADSESASGEHAASAQSAERESAAVSETSQAGIGGTEVRPDGRPQLTVIEGALSVKEEVDADAGEVAKAALTEAIAEQKAEQQPAEERSPDEVAVDATVMLTRFAWLKSVEEVQVTRRLYRSGESEFFINRVPCRLRDLKDLFRVIGLGARTYTIVAQGEVSRIVTSKPEERRLMVEEAAGVAGFRDRIAAAERRLEETSVNITRLEDVIKEVTRQVNSLRVQASRARNREQLRARVAELERALFSDSLAYHQQELGRKRLALDQAGQAENLSDSNFQRLQAEEQEARGALMSLDVESDTLRSRMDGLREELETRNRARSEKASRLIELRAHTTGRQNEISSLEERRFILGQRLEDVQREIQGLEEQEKDLSQQIGGIGSQSEEEIRQAAADLQNLRSEMKAKEQRLRSLRDELVSAESRYQALAEQITAALPVNQLKKALGEKLGKQGEMLDDAARALVDQLGAEAKLFADGLNVPLQYARAVQAVLAERAAFIISRNPHALARAYAAQTASSSAADAIPALGVFKAGDGITEAATVGSGAEPPAGLTPALSVIQVSGEASYAAKRLLGNVFFCDSLESALNYFERAASAGEETVLATLAGEIVTAYSFFSMRHNGGLIQLKQEAEILSSAVAQYQLQHAELAAEREKQQALITEAETRHSQALAENQEKQAFVRELSNQQGSVRGRLQTAARLTEQLEQDIQRTLDLVRNAQARIAEYQAQEAELKIELEALSAGDEEQIKQELEVVRSQYQTLDDGRKEGRQKLSEVSLRFDEARRAREEARNATAKCTLDLQRMEMEIQAVKERFVAEYGAAVVEEIETALKACSAQPDVAALSDEVRLQFAEEAQKLRARIIREGEVDSSSIQRFEEEQARLDNLAKQKDDLQSAAATLKRTIERLTTTSEQRFLATFAIVRENFANLIPRLFGGGKGSLELTDAAHPLDSGVDIVVRPPGKKLKSIDLMSGGEKALCAIGMIFAMFLHRPSPLCVLDEVDAPLDEANLMRYLHMVKEMSKRTQFLMITHNKQSMAMADNLVGVTMQQPGASCIISVSLQEAYQHVA